MTDRPYLFDFNGNPMDIEQWSELYEHADRTVAKDHIGEYWISTVWFGMDISVDGGPPLIYETMVFMGPTLADALTNPLSFADRYATRTQALAGHDQIMAHIRQRITHDQQR